MFGRLNIVLALLLVAVVVLAMNVGGDHTRPNLEFLPEMKYSPAWSAFEANPNFPNGRTLQAPPPGTIARGALPLYYAATKEDAVRAGEELRNPYTATPTEKTPSTEIEKKKQAAEVAARLGESVQRGNDVYHIFCITCHGPKGAGDGPVPQRGFPPPPSLLTGKSPQMKDGQLFHILTYGQGNMSPFTAQLSRGRRWDVINFIRDMQSKAPTTPIQPTKTNQPVKKAAGEQPK